MITVVIFGIFFILAVSSLAIYRIRTIKNVKSIKKILAHSPKDEDNAMIGMTGFRITSGGY